MPSLSKYPGAAASIDAESGSVNWNYVSDVIGNTSNSATISLSQSEPHGDYLVVSDLGFTVPKLASIDGVVVAVDRVSNLDRSIDDNHIRIFHSGIPYGEDKYIGYWTDSWTLSTVGSPADKWGFLAAKDYSFVNDSTFGVGFAPQYGDVYGPLVEGEIRTIEVTIYYSINSIKVGTTSVVNMYLGTVEVSDTAFSGVITGTIFV